MKWAADKIPLILVIILLFCVFGMQFILNSNAKKTQQYAKESVEATNRVKALVSSIEKKNVALRDSIKVLNDQIETFKTNIQHEKAENIRNKAKIARLYRDGINDSQRDSLIQSINESQ